MLEPNASNYTRLWVLKGFDLCVQMTKYPARAHSCLIMLLQGCNTLKMPFVAVKEAKPNLGFTLLFQRNGSCEDSNVRYQQNGKGKENKSYPLKKPLCNPFLPETFRIWWGPSETPSRCYRAETPCLGSRRQELGGLSAGRQSGSKI